MTCRSNWIVAAALVAMLTGCTNLMSKRAIDQFAESLQEQNLDRLKEASSADFERKALRQQDATQGLKVLKLPEGEKMEIVSVEELSPRSRKVMVKIGPKKDFDKKAEELEYRLTKDERGGKWVVDDIIMLQDSGKGDLVERSVSDQMDLLLTCRELLISWHGGTREDKLRFCTESLQQDLATLPAAWFETLSEEIASSNHKGSFRPDARIRGEKAFVVVPHTTGKLYLEMKQEADGWKLTDMAVEPASKESTGIRNLTKLAKALNLGATFLTGYDGMDRKKLEKATSSTFFKSCLAEADLTEVPLPVSSLLEGNYEARQYTDGSQKVTRVELLFTEANQTYMLTLREFDLKDANGVTSTANLRVDDVTIFDKTQNDVKQLSAMFLSHAIANVYVTALRERDLDKLRELASIDFQERVWNRSDARHFAIMADPVIPPGEPEVIATNFRGEDTELTLAVGDQPLTLMLRQSRGWLVVDDVILPAFDRPTSLKENLETLLPVHSFAAAALRKDMNALIRTSSDPLDRTVWRQLRSTPELVQHFIQPMHGEVVSIRKGEPWTVVRTSDGSTISEIQLAREGSQYVVNDVIVIENTDGGTRLELMATLKEMIASGVIGPAARLRENPIQHASAEMPAAAPTSRVEPARFEPINPRELLP